ncbi:MAG: DUF1330 domain-containing protein [Geminicoccales bacterium]
MFDFPSTSGKRAVGRDDNKKQRPAYFLARHQVLDRETLNKIYVPKAVDCLNNFDVEILIVHESVEVVEGQTGHDHLVILRFPSRVEAMRWYHSPEDHHLRLNSADGILLLAEGLAPEDLASAERSEWQATLIAAPPVHPPYPRTAFDPVS